MLELIYTSARSGLKTGSSGFTFVAWTEGLPPHFLAPLENVSGYKPVWLPGTPEYAGNPVSFSYRKIRYGSLSFHALSRIGSAGLDYSGRSNKLAHHILPDEGELNGFPYGPCGYFLADGNFHSRWDREPELLRERHLKEPAVPQTWVARNWARRKGDAGWAGVAAAKLEALIQCGRTEDEAVYLEYTPDFPPEEVLQMVAEAVLLLPPELQKQSTFDTYFIQPLLGVETLLRCGFPDNPVLQTMRRLRPDQVISLAGEEPIPPGMETHPYIRTARGELAPQRTQPEEGESIVELPPRLATVSAPDALTEDCINITRSKVVVPPHLNNSRKPERTAEESLPTAEYPKQKLLFIFLMAAVMLGIGLFMYWKMHRSVPPAPTSAVNTENAFSGVTEGKEAVSKPATIPVQPVAQKEVQPLRKKTAAPVPAAVAPAVKKTTAHHPPVKKKPQAPLPRPEEARKFFFELNKAVDKGSDSAVLFTCHQNIQSLCIHTFSGKELKGKQVDYPEAQGKIFTFTLQGKSLCVQDISTEALSPRNVACIKEIRFLTLSLQDGSVNLDLSRVIPDLLPKLQPVFKASENFQLSMDDSEDLKKNNWLDKYIEKPDFKLSHFTNLYKLMMEWNRCKERFKNEKSKEKEYQENAKKEWDKYRKLKPALQKQEVELKTVRDAIGHLINTYPCKNEKEFQKERKWLMEKQKTAGYDENIPSSQDGQQDWKTIHGTAEKSKKQFEKAKTAFKAEFDKVGLKSFCSFEDFSTGKINRINIIEQAAKKLGGYRAKQ